MVDVIDLCGDEDLTTTQVATKPLTAEADGPTVAVAPTSLLATAMAHSDVGHKLGAKKVALAAPVRNAAASPPAAKKRRTVDAGQNVVVAKPGSPANKRAIFERWALDVGSMKKRNAAALKELEKEQEADLLALEDRIEKEKEALVAATESCKEDSECVQCSKVLAYGGEFFVCAACSERVCDSHREEMTTCEKCSKPYCSACSQALDKCSGCAKCPQLTCCNLEKMPCGEFESGDCSYYHSKFCSCIQDSENCSRCNKWYQMG